jgi:hypothetical protein
MKTYNTKSNEIDPEFTFPSKDSDVLYDLRKSSGLQLDHSLSEFDNAKNIIGYAHKLFTHDGDNTPSVNDPLTILKEAKEGMSFRCVEYSLLAVGLLWAYDIPARTVGLKMKDVETREHGAGHVVIEFWSSEYKKWVMCDVQAGVIPKSSENPLSAYELSEMLQVGGDVSYELITNSRFGKAKSYTDDSSYSKWINEYLYFINTPLEITLESVDRSLHKIVMLVPIGVEPPKSFQGMFDMNAIYTHSIIDFYPISI